MTAPSIILQRPAGPTPAVPASATEQVLVELRAERVAKIAPLSNDSARRMIEYAARDRAQAAEAAGDLVEARRFDALRAIATAPASRFDAAFGQWLADFTRDLECGT